MKKIFLITAILIFTSFELYSQSGNSCDEAIPITAGTHAVNGINGNSFELCIFLKNISCGNAKLFLL